MILAPPLQQLEIVLTGNGPEMVITLADFPVPDRYLNPTPLQSRRHEYVAPNVSYVATAPLDSLETAPVWRITRITVANDGTTTKAVAENVAWSDRATSFV